MKKINVLCLDIEGGHGGSSRSLFYLLKKINKKKFKIEVICKKNSWIKKEYKRYKIQCTVEKTMPCYVPLEILNRNFFSFLFFLIFTWPRSKEFRAKLIHKLKKIDILHCNQISLFFVALWIKKKIPNIKITFHIRTMFWPYKKNRWHFIYRWVIKSAFKVCDSFLFITENEEKNVNEILNSKTNGHVIHNPLSDYSIKKINLNKKNKVIKIISMSHHDFERGTDRIIELAARIPKQFHHKFQFIMLGDYIHSSNFFEKLFKNTAMNKNLKKYAENLKVKNMFKFYGYVKTPELFLKQSDLLIKLTRRPNPWGRHILEAMGLGKAIIPCGTYDKFVKTNINGILLNKYKPKKIVNWLLKIEKKRNSLNKMKTNSLKKINELCSQKQQAKKIEKIWRDLA